MKRLRRIQLINWHRLTNQTFDIDGHLLLMGDNGSGKSTILDALQVGLVGNMRAVRLNLAANDGGDRNLKSYVLGTIGSADSAASSRTLRKRATAYILLEFHDSVANENFVLGTVIDANSDGRSAEKEHFIAHGMTAQECPAVDAKNAPRSVKQFKKEIQGHKSFRRYPRTEDYQQAVLSELGGIDPDFFRLFVSGMAFRKIRHLRDFVYDFLLPDSGAMDVSHLREAADRYRQLKELAQEARTRLQLLDQILANANSAASTHKQRKILQAKIERAKVAQADFAKRDAIQTVEEAETELSESQADHAACEQQSQDARERLNRLQTELASHEQHASAFLLQSKIDQLADSIRRENRDFERLQTGLRFARDAWARFQKETQITADSQSSPKANSLFETVPREVIPGLFQFDEAAARCLAGEALEDEQRADLQSTAKNWPIVSHGLQSQEFQTESLVTATQNEIRETETELRGCRSGQMPLPKDVQSVKDQLANAGISAQVLAELISVTSPKIAPLVNRYLGMKRFDLLVASEDFSKAAAIYQDLDTLEISSPGLVNTPALLSAELEAKPNSIATKIHSDHPLAKIYVNAILGHVFSCSEKEWKRTEFVLTDHVMLAGPDLIVSQFAIRKHNPRAEFLDWQADDGEVSERQASLQNRIADLQAKLQELNAAKKRWSQLVELFDQGRRGVEILADDFELPNRLSQLRSEYVDAREEAAQIQNSNLGELQQMVQSAEKDERTASTQLKHAWGRQRVAEESLRIAQRSLAKTESQSEQLWSVYRDTWESDTEIFSGIEQFFQSEVTADTLEEHLRQWTLEFQAIEQGSRKQHDEAVRLKTEYNNRFEFSGDSLSEDITAYRAEYERWGDSELPGFQSQLEMAEQTASQVLEEDVIHRLHERLLQVERQFAELNGALKGLEFSGRQYRFVFAVRPEFRPFYEMVMDSHQLDDRPLHNSDWHKKYGAGPLQELLAEVLGQSGENALGDLEKRIDYRSYFDYDIEISDPDGSTHRFSHVAASGSGGETQTPYYVAMLASLSRVYGRSHGKAQVAGLVAFDEPFQKMDESNIAATLQLARRLGLQILLAAPKDRSHQLLPAMGTATCLLVLRKGNRVHLEPFQRYADDVTSSESLIGNTP